MAEEVTLRPGTPADVPALRALGEAVVPPTYGPIDAAYAQRMLDEWWTPERFTASLARNAHLMAESDGQVVAMANIGRVSASYRDFPHVTGDREVMWKLSYRAHGFVEVERVAGASWPDDVWMRKDLARSRS